MLLGYEVLDKGVDSKRKYGGSTGWVLAHDKERDLWQVQHHHYPFLTISMEDKDSLPVGIHQWVVANDTCNLGQTTRFLIKTSYLYETYLLSEPVKFLGLNFQCSATAECLSE